MAAPPPARTTRDDVPPGWRRLLGGLPHVARSLQGGLPPGARSAKGGFSLLELLLVVAIMGMLAALVLPYLPGALESSRFRGSAAEVRATLTLARTLAVSEARNRTVAIDLDRGEYGIDGDGRKWLLPEGVRVAAVRIGDLAAERGVVRIRFYPDGSADEAEVAISSSGGGRKRILVDPLTGMAREIA